MRVVIFHASAGHGHQKAAEAVREGLLAEGVPEKEILLRDALDDTPPWFKKYYTSLYYYSVKHTPNLWGATYHLAEHPWLYEIIGRRVRRLINGGMAKRLVELLLREKPQAVICTHFMSPEVVGHLKSSGRFDTFLISAVTDFVPHTFWVNPGTDHYWVMSDEGKENLLRRGLLPERVTAGGIPISLRFRPQNKGKEIRRREGLDLNRFTLLITSGSFGLGPANEVLRCLQEFSEKIQVLVVCGNNQRQYDLLRNGHFPFPIKVYGFVSNMDELMEASDLLIAKPGGATTSESLAKGIPMVVLEPIPGQETGNAHLLRERNAAFFLGKPEDIRIILKGIFDYPQVLEEKMRAIHKLAKPDAAIDLARLVLSKIGR